MEYFFEYSTVIIVIFLFFIQNKLFITPEALEKKHRDILSEVEKRFATLVYVDELKEDFSDMKHKIDKIYEYFMKNL